MPRVSKEGLAEKLSWMSRSPELEPTATLMLDPPPSPPPPPMAAEYEPEAPPNLESPVEDELLPTVEVKVEPLEVLQEDEIEVEVELFSSKDSTLAGEMHDPIGEEPTRKVFDEEQEVVRCQFCLKHFWEAEPGRSGISRSKIEFVLGLSEWGTPGMWPVCCDGCRKMFDLFYAFKQSCLAALARPAELLRWAGPNKSAPKLIDCKPKVIRKVKAKKMDDKSEQSEDNNTQAVQKTEELAGLLPEGAAKSKGLEEQIQSAEAPPFDLQQFKKPGFECQICLKQFRYGAPFRKHWQTHFPLSQTATLADSATEETSTNPLIPEVHLDILASGSDPSSIPDAYPNIPAPEPDSPIAATKTEDEDQKRTYCDRCRKWFPTKTIYVHHKPFCIKFKERPPPSFACSQCPKKFRQEKDLALHVNRHNGIRTIPCRREGCTKKFFDINLRRGHEHTCGQAAKHICSICGSMFRSLGCLRLHMATHEDPQYSCEICQKAFHRKASLKKHAASHSDERKFQCKVCGKAFKSHEANRVHQRIHTQERPYACTICGQRFMYNCMLKTHLEKGHEAM